MPAIIKLAGWAELQHYKDRSPPWVKLYRELLTSESWVLGTDTSRLVQVASMLLAARYNNEIPYRWDLIKKVSHLECTESAFRSAVLHLVAYKFLEIHEVTSDEESVLQDASGVLAKCSSEERRGETEKRQRREDPSASSTPTNATKPLTVSRETDSEWFLDFKLAYPNRAGDQGWRKAQRAANERIREGHSPTEFIEGAKRYAEFCRVTGKLGTEFTKQAATFLGPDKPFLQPWAAPATKADNRLAGNLSAAEEFMRRTDTTQ